MKTLTYIIVESFICLILTCAPMPLENSDTFPIRLSLERAGTTEAEFSGEPILAIVETPDSVMFSSLTWKTGKGKYWTTDSWLTKKSRKFQAQLSWETYPLIKDSLGNVYDTIFIGIGGNLYRSNNVRVKISNLPVVIDSLKVSVKTFKSIDYMWNFAVPDSISKLQMRMFARDLDDVKKTPSISIIGSNYNLEQNMTLPMQMTYSCPSGFFQDTLTFIVYDHARGQAIRSLHLHRIYPNKPPVIDSVTISGRNFKIVSQYTKAIFEKIDTLKFVAYYHDTHDSIKAITWKSSRNITSSDSIHQENMKYICTSSACSDTPGKGFTTIDTVWLKVFDSKNDSSRAAIILVKGILNRPPLIEMISVNGNKIADSVSEESLLTGKGLMQYQLSVIATDPDSDDVQIQWNSKYGTIIPKNGTDVEYTAPATLITDTVTVTISDGEYSTIKKIVIKIDDIVPIFDSLVINKIRYTSKTSSFEYNASIGEKLIITAWVQDKDKKDTLKYIWSMSDTSKIASKINSRIIVQLPAKAYNDTISLTLEDGTYTNTVMILIKAAVQEPIIDSIRIRAQSFKSTVQSISDSATYPDTLPIKVFAHDNQADTIYYAMSAIFKKSLTMVDTITYRYIPIDSTYTDTIKIVVIDSKGNQADKNVTLKIKKSTTILE